MAFGGAWGFFNPEESAQKVIPLIIAGGPNVQKSMIEAYFTEDCTYRSSLIRLPSFTCADSRIPFIKSLKSRDFLRAIYKWRRYFSQGVFLVESYAYDKKRAKLFLHVFEKFRIPFLPWHAALVKTVIVLKLRPVDLDADGGVHPVEIPLLITARERKPQTAKAAAATEQKDTVKDTLNTNENVRVKVAQVLAGMNKEKQDEQKQDAKSAPTTKLNGQDKADVQRGTKLGGTKPQAQEKVTAGPAPEVITKPQNSDPEHESNVSRKIVVVPKGDIVADLGDINTPKIKPQDDDKSSHQSNEGVNSSPERRINTSSKSGAGAEGRPRSADSGKTLTGPEVLEPEDDSLEVRAESDSEDPTFFRKINDKTSGKANGKANGKTNGGGTISLGNNGNDEGNEKALSLLFSEDFYKPGGAKAPWVFGGDVLKTEQQDDKNNKNNKNGNGQQQQHANANATTTTKPPARRATNDLAVRRPRGDGDDLASRLPPARPDMARRWLIESQEDACSALDLARAYSYLSPGVALLVLAQSALCILAVVAWAPSYLKQKRRPRH